MKNIISYTEQIKDSFTKRPFHAVDSLILSQLSYLNFAKLVPGLGNYVPSVRLSNLANSVWVESLFSSIRNREENERLFYSAARSPRYCNIELNYYVSDFKASEEKQFCAVTYFLDDGTGYVAYRGTDSTFVGWKEDFNMAFQTPVPAQEEGVLYLQQVAAKTNRLLRVGGHSKGGNIAVYSALQCGKRLQNRILEVFSHDGPGFRDNIFRSEEYYALRGKINKTLPQDSLVGMLLQHMEDYYVVKSNRFWIFQHDPFSWEVKDGNFVYIKDITDEADFFDRTLNEWICSLSAERRELFADTLYKILQATGVDSFQKFSFRTLGKIDEVADTLFHLDSDTKRYLMESLRALFMLGAKNFLKLPFESMLDDQNEKSNDSVEIQAQENV